LDLHYLVVREPTNLWKLNGNGQGQTKHKRMLCAQCSHNIMKKFYYHIKR
jgi:hypothetical protein